MNLKREHSEFSAVMTVEASSSLPHSFKVIGVLNLLFGGALLLCGSVGVWLIGPFLVENSPFQLNPAQTRQIAAELRKQMIEDAKRDERIAKNAATKDRIRKSREDLEATPENLELKVDFHKINASLPWLSRYLWAEIVTGPILNLFMVFSGLGLILGKTRGRKLALGVACLKILRLALLSLFLGLIVVPGVRGTMDEFAKTEFARLILHQAIESRNADGMPTAQIELSEFVQMIAALGYGYALMSLALGAIYPVISLILLTRARTTQPISQRTVSD